MTKLNTLQKGRAKAITWKNFPRILSPQVNSRTAKCECVMDLQPYPFACNTPTSSTILLILSIKVLPTQKNVERNSPAISTGQILFAGHESKNATTFPCEIEKRKNNECNYRFQYIINWNYVCTTNYECCNNKPFGLLVNWHYNHQSSRLETLRRAECLESLRKVSDQKYCHHRQNRGLLVWYCWTLSSWAPLDGLKHHAECSYEIDKCRAWARTNEHMVSLY